MVDTGSPREVDAAAIDGYLAYGYIQAPRSIWRHVKKLPPAHTLVWENGSTRIERYWRLDYSEKADAPLPELEEELRRQVAAAVRRRMIADVPLGALLSGGVDSSVVVAEMAAAAPRPVRQGAAAAADRLLQAGDARGMRSYGRRFLTSMGKDAPGRYADQVCIFNRSERGALLGEPVSAAGRSATEDVIAGPWREASGHSRLDVLLETDVNTYLPGDLLVKMDIASMAYSLEARSPLLDPEVMQFAASLPARYKARLASKKRILRRAYRGRIPDEVLDGKKRGFGVPLGDWFRNELRDFTRDVLLDPRAVNRGLIDPAPVRALLDQHDRGGADRSMQIWALLMLELW